MPAATVSDEISALTRRGPSRGRRKGKPYNRSQAIAAAMNMARKGDFGPKATRKASRRFRKLGRSR